MLFLPLYRQPVARCYRYVMDDVSKVTLPAWPGQGMDAIVIFRTLSPFVLLSVPGYYLLSAVIWIFLLYLFVAWLIGVVVVNICSFGLYCGLL